MTTLKFIDLLIDWANKHITKTKNDLNLYEENNRYPEQLKLQLEAEENRLKYLLKVKEELEAWEIVAAALIEGKLVGLSYFLKNDIEKFNTIKKALEVKDE